MTNCPPIPVTPQVVAVLRRLIEYCQANEWAGYDPYDALNSPIFEKLPVLNHRIPRLLATQALKRSPLNVRRALFVPRTQNAKGIALFLSAFLKLSGTKFADLEQLIEYMIERLIALRSMTSDYPCWGYSFPWQTRTKIVPAGAPNLVCTTFVGNALIDAYEQRQDARCLEMAVGAAEYLINELYWDNGTSAGLSYPLPESRGEVHNANFLGAALLCRIYAHTREERFLGPAIRVARYSASKQRDDGSWYYGEAPSQHWIDNFHTGYNLCALQILAKYSDDKIFDSYLQHGFEFYQKQFFRTDGAARYFHDRTYPIDIHSVAQSIITLTAFKNADAQNIFRAGQVFRWAVEHMWDESGYFHYRVLRFGKIRTPYMRWSQAWMVLALATFLTESANEKWSAVTMSSREAQSQR